MFFECAHSLIAPVESYSDVTLDLTSLVLGEMTLDQLPTQVDELIHHMTQLMEQIHLVFLMKQPKRLKLGYVSSSYCRIYDKAISETLLRPDIICRIIDCIVGLIYLRFI